MKKIFVIVTMMLSSLSWGLTFKNGKLIEDDDQIIKIQKEENYKNCTKVNIKNYLLMKN